MAGKEGMVKITLTLPSSLMEELKKIPDGYRSRFVALVLKQAIARRIHIKYAMSIFQKTVLQGE